MQRHLCLAVSRSSIGGAGGEHVPSIDSVLYGRLRKISTPSPSSSSFEGAWGAVLAVKNVLSPCLHKSVVGGVDGIYDERSLRQISRSPWLVHDLLTGTAVGSSTRHHQLFLCLFCSLVFLPAIWRERKKTSRICLLWSLTPPQSIRGQGFVVLLRTFYLWTQCCQKSVMTRVCNTERKAWWAKWRGGDKTRKYVSTRAFVSWDSSLFERDRSFADGKRVEPGEEDLRSCERNRNKKQALNSSWRRRWWENRTGVFATWRESNLGSLKEVQQRQSMLTTTGSKLLCPFYGRSSEILVWFAASILHSVGSVNSMSTRSCGCCGRLRRWICARRRRRRITGGRLAMRTRIMTTAFKSSSSACRQRPLHQQSGKLLPPVCLQLMNSSSKDSFCLFIFLPVFEWSRDSRRRQRRSRSSWRASTLAR